MRRGHTDHTATRCCSSSICVSLFLVVIFTTKVLDLVLSRVLLFDILSVFPNFFHLNNLYVNPGQFQRYTSRKPAITNSVFLKSKQDEKCCHLLPWTSSGLKHCHSGMLYSCKKTIPFYNNLGARETFHSRLEEVFSFFLNVMLRYKHNQINIYCVWWLHGIHSKNHCASALVKNFYLTP